MEEIHDERIELESKSVESGLEEVEGEEEESW